MTRFTVTGDAGGAVKAVNDLVKAVIKGEEAFEKVSKKADKLDKAAQQITRNNEGPQERYNRKIAELAELVNKGKLSFEQADIAARRYSKELEKAGDAGRTAFGPAALNNLKQFALGMVGIQQAAQLGLAAIRAMDQEIEQAAQRQMASRRGLGSLSQLASTAENPQQEMASLLREARAIRASGAAETDDEAGNILFSLVSAGLTKEDRDFAVALKRSGVLSDVGGASTSFAALQTALGAGEVGSFQDFMSKALAASAAAPAQANEIPIAAARAGGSAREMGLSDEFLFASTALIAKQTGSASEAGTLLAGFLKGVEKSGLDVKGKTGLEIVEMLSALPADKQGIGGVLGESQEAISGFRVLRDNLGALTALQGSIERGQASGLAAAAVGLPSGDAALAAAQARAGAEGRYDRALDPYAIEKNLLEAAFRERAATRLESGSMFAASDIFIEDMQKRAFGWIPAERRAMLEGMANDGSIRNEQLLREIRDYLRGPVTTRQE